MDTDELMREAMDTLKASWPEDHEESLASAQVCALLAIARELKRMNDEREGSRQGIGGNLWRLRKQEGETLREAAEAAGISVSFLSDMERGVSNPSLETLGKLAAHYGVPPGDLLNNTHGAPPEPERGQAATTFGELGVGELFRCGNENAYYVKVDLRANSLNSIEIEDGVTKWVFFASDCEVVRLAVNEVNHE